MGSVVSYEERLLHRQGRERLAELRATLDSGDTDGVITRAEALAILDVLDDLETVSICVVQAVSDAVASRWQLVFLPRDARSSDKCDALSPARP